MSVPHGRYDARRTVTTFPAYAGAKLYCLVAEARVCVNESLGVTAQRPEVETGDLLVACPGRVRTTTSPSYNGYCLAKRNCGHLRRDRFITLFVV